MYLNGCRNDYFTDYRAVLIAVKYRYLTALEAPLHSFIAFMAFIAFMTFIAFIASARSYFLVGQTNRPTSHPSGQLVAN